jgi:signal transduction histidine kinase
MRLDPRAIRSGRRDRRLEHLRIRSIVERLADGIIVVGLDGIIRFVNPAAAQLFARDGADLTGTYLGFTAVTGESAEIDVLRPGGGTIAVELRVVDIEWEGEPARLATLRDVTDRRGAQERAIQLERERAARAEAEAASRAKSEFLAMMSHELRTPLNAVMGYAQLLNLGIPGSLNEVQRDQIERIHKCAHHLLGLVDDVLDLARADAGRLLLTNRPASMAQLIAAAVTIVQPNAAARGVAIEADEATGDADLYVGDEDRAGQILVNLLSNAVKFTPPGGRVTIAHGYGDRDGTMAYVRVTDTGIGIPADQLDAIFDPFIQVEGGHTRSADGAGLGLTIGRRLARLMKGELTGESTIGRGSTFTLWLCAAPS